MNKQLAKVTTFDKNRDLVTDHNHSQDDTQSSKNSKRFQPETKDINGNDFKCDQCSFSTANKWGLRQHKESYFEAFYTVLPLYLYYTSCITDQSKFIRRTTLSNVVYAISNQNGKFH